MDQNQSTTYEYDVDLRRYIRIIWREKWLILLIFLISAGLAYGFFETRPPQYSTQTTLLITPRVAEQLESAQGGGISSTAMPDDIYKKSATADDLLQKIINSLDIDGENAEGLSVNGLESKLDVEISTMENRGAGSSDLPLITMTVTGSDPERIKRIADEWTNLFVERNTELLSSETARSYEFISERFTEVSQDLADKENQKLAYKEEHPVEVLKSEVEVLQWKYRDFLSRLQRNKADLVSKRARLGEINNILEEEPRFLQLERSIPRENLWNLLRGLKAGDADSEEEGAKKELGEWSDFSVNDQQVNEVYFDLKKEQGGLQADISSLREEVDYLSTRTEELSQRIEEKQLEIDRAELRLDQLTREIDRLNSTYDTLSANLTEARIANEEKESSIRVVENAVKPESPIGSSTRQNVALGGVLGLFIGILAAFFKHYMQGYDLKDGEETNSDEAKEQDESEPEE